MARIELYATGQNSLSHWKARIWLPVAFKKKFQTYPPKPAEAKPSLKKVSLPSAKLHTLYLAHLWVREFWAQTYSLWQALDWGLLSKILASTKWVGPRVLNGQLSRVPWPGNSWMPLTFLWALQQPHKHSHSLQLATHTQLAHQNCFHANVKVST